MRGNKRKNAFSLAWSIRTGVIVTLLLLLVVSSAYFLSRSKKKPQIQSEITEIPQQKIEKVEQISHFEAKGAKGNFSLKANQHYKGKDENYYLEGDVEVIDFGKNESDNVFIRGEKVIYDKDLIHFVMEGKSQVKYKDWVINSKLLNYDKNKEIFTSDKGISFFSQSIKGAAPKMLYSLKQEILRLKEKIRIELTQDEKDVFPLVIEANGLEYYRKKREGEAAGDVYLSQNNSFARANTMKFLLSKDERNVESIILKGEVSVFLVDESIKNRNLSQGRLIIPGGKNEIEAEEIQLQVEQKLSRVSQIKTKGKCRIKSFDDSGNYIEIQGEFLDFQFTPGGELRKFYALDNVTVVEHEEETGIQRYLAGQEIILDQESNTLKIKGKKTTEAQIVSQENEIYADEIIINLENNDVEAFGGIKVVSKQMERKRSVGYFSDKLPVFFIAQEMRYESEKKRFFFKKKIKVWQREKMLLTDELSLFEDRGELNCRGGVKTVFPLELKDKGKKERIEISSDLMNFNSQQNIVSFEKKTFLKYEDVNLRANSVSIRFGEQNNSLNRILAHGGVTFSRERVRGRAEDVLYDLDEQAVILTGDPVLEDSNRGITRGDKLTFYLGDGRIVVENRGRKRSVTVIKS